MTDAGSPVDDARWSTLSGPAREAVKRHSEALRQLRAATRELHHLTRHGRPAQAVDDARRRLRVATAVERLAHRQAAELTGDLAPPDGRAANSSSPDDDPEEDGAPLRSARPGHARPSRRDERTRRDDPTRCARRRALVAATLVGAFGGLGSVTVAAADAGPGSPLWPITKVVYADTAHQRQAQADAYAALAKARTALADGRLNAAAQHLDDAAQSAAKVGPANADDLRSAVDRLRAQLQREQTHEAPPSQSPPAGGVPTDESPAPDPQQPTTDPEQPEDPTTEPEEPTTEPEEPDTGPSPEPTPEDPGTDPSDGDDSRGGAGDGNSGNGSGDRTGKPEQSDKSDRGERERGESGKGEGSPKASKRADHANAGEGRGAASKAADN